MEVKTNELLEKLLAGRNPTLDKVVAEQGIITRAKLMKNQYGCDGTCPCGKACTKPYGHAWGCNCGGH